MAETRPSCRLRVILATGSRKAIVFRRGPSKTTRLIAWDLANDTFEPGQWLRNASVYPERSAISPDGSHLLIFIGRFRRPFHAYTVLSRVPWFTALALWPVDHTWGGGGTFLGPRELVLDHKPDEAKLAPGFASPAGFVVHPCTAMTRARVEGFWARHSAWKVQENNGVACLANAAADGVTLVATPRKVGKYLTELAFAIERGAHSVSLGSAQWADLDANGDVLFAKRGALDRLPAAAIAAALADGDVASRAKRLADFSDMTFEALAAPYPTARDPGGETAAFAPRLDRVGKEDRRQRRAERKARDARPERKG